MKYKNKYYPIFANEGGTIADKSICNYVCYDSTNKIHYLAINPYRDLLGDNYAKPLYIEEMPFVSDYLPNCKKSEFRGIPFISLIKNKERRYRLNKNIYSESKQILGLKSEKNLSFPFNLLKIPKKHISEIILPSEAFKKALRKNKLVKELVRTGPKAFFSYGVEIGLIGSISFDPSFQAKDIDLVFSGDPLKIQKIYEWFSYKKDSKLSPLQRKSPFISVLLCSFFSIQDQYPKEVTSLHIKTKNTTRNKIRIIRHLNSPYLNLQCYEIINLQSKAKQELWVRDTLGRCVLHPNEEVVIDAYLSESLGKKVLFLTDVEQQLHGKNVHFD